MTFRLPWRPLLLVAIITLASAALAPTASGKVRARSVWWGALVKGDGAEGDPPWDMRALSRFERATGRRVAILHFGLPWSYHGRPRSFDPTAMNALRRRGVIPLVDWASWDIPAPVVTTQPAFALRTIIRGQHDGYIRAWARAARAWRHPFFLRFDHEMNGDWFPWSERRNGNRPGEFIRAWRHVHRIFEQEGASNVTWVWSPNALHPRGIPLKSVFPGRPYVDWVAVDGYNWGRMPSKPGGRWQSLVQILAPTYAQLRRLDPAAPIMVAETSSTEVGGNKAVWIRDAFRDLPRRFPAIRAVLWFDWEVGGHDWPVTTSKAATAAMKRALQATWIAGGPVRPPDRRPITAP